MAMYKLYDGISINMKHITAIGPVTARDQYHWYYRIYPQPFNEENFYVNSFNDQYIATESRNNLIRLVDNLS